MVKRKLFLSAALNIDMKAEAKTPYCLSFVLLILVSQISPVGSDPPKKHCVCVPAGTFAKLPTTKLGYYAAAAACLAPLGLVAASVPLLAFAGFTAGGIAGGSFGAWLMSFSGGATAAGGLVATLQSWGAVGVGASAWAGAGGILAFCAAILFPKLFEKYRTANPKDYICFFDEEYTGTAGFPSGGSGGSGASPSASSSTDLPKKAFEMYPDGKQVTRKEIDETQLHEECDIHQRPGEGPDKKPGNGPDDGPDKAGKKPTDKPGATAVDNEGAAAVQGCG